MNGTTKQLKQSIKDEISKLYRIRKLPEFPWFRKPRHEQHCISYQKRIGILVASKTVVFVRLLSYWMCGDNSNEKRS